MTQWYWCETCQDVKQDGYDEGIAEVQYPDGSMSGHVCKKCGDPVEPHETYDCPIHGTNAPDGSGNCAKC